MTIRTASRSPMRSSPRSLWLTVIALSILAIVAGPSRPALAEVTFEVVKSFTLPDQSPNALVEGSDGALYGINRGAFGESGVFRIDNTGNLTQLHSFNSAIAGSGYYVDPTEALVVGLDGALYGATSNGGSSYQGTVFRIENAGNFSYLHSFSGAEGSQPSGLVVGSDGALYGSTNANWFPRSSGSTARKTSPCLTRSPRGGASTSPMLRSPWPATAPSMAFLARTAHQTAG